MTVQHDWSGSETITAPQSPTNTKAKSAIEFTHQSEKLGLLRSVQANGSTGRLAAEAIFITAQDPIIQTRNGERLPAVPLTEALKLNRLRAELEGRDLNVSGPQQFPTREGLDGTIHGIETPAELKRRRTSKADAPLGDALPPTRTNPLFPPLPLYGPPSLMRDAHALFFRASSAVLSFLFLLVIILGAFFMSGPEMWNNLRVKIKLGEIAKARPFYEEEKKRAKLREQAEKEWEAVKYTVPEEKPLRHRTEEFVPTEGGPDPLVCDVGYYARRIGLDAETFQVQTEDGFIIDLWHIYDPAVQEPKSEAAHEPLSPSIFKHDSLDPLDQDKTSSRKYPVLLIHGLLQSAGAYCCTDDDSLAFYLAKSGLDVWLGNNRCGFNPRHTLLHPSDPRMWNWNIRQMGVLDLPALISRVLTETGFEKLALLAHSQGTTQTLVALAKEQRPEIGDKISIVCLLAPAAYAGPLIDKIYLKIMSVMSYNMFRATFGIHSFIPFMMSMHKLLPGKIYGFMGYRVFSFLFNWTDKRWDRALRDRCFQFAPVYVSAESMRWWLGRECFAKQRCILSTMSELEIEDQEDDASSDEDSPSRKDPGRYAWYDEHVPPFALWVAGNDDLVDGQRLLRRFRKGREPHVKVVHEKVIPDYEHLDVIWAIDVIEQVGREVLECIWKTVPVKYRNTLKTPRGCEKVTFLEDKDED